MRYAFEYAIVRVVPHLEREEFINAGAIVFCGANEFLAARVELDAQRLLALAPEADPAFVRDHLDAIVRVCDGGPASGPIGALPQRERFRWLVAPRSTMLQTSPAHAGLCEDPNRVLEALIERSVRIRSGTSGAGP
jgi:hypothetical protein